MDEILHQDLAQDELNTVLAVVVQGEMNQSNLIFPLVQDVYQVNEFEELPCQGQTKYQSYFVLTGEKNSRINFCYFSKKPTYYQLMEVLLNSRSQAWSRLLKLQATTVFVMVAVPIDF
ncbi:hypothetical protein C5167_015280 [Papaver somniferum]|uniref:Uncharacterized protein n=1 Tax=Papaver somniferum TaxID=3469 RepID=A0A4Y7J7G6_PAPSO|nr:hypothetical protein C5167_015280 [Papaver somniferum]